MSLISWDPKLAKIIQAEEKRQQKTINLIASENYTSKAVREALSSVFVNKYSEGYPGRRYYAGNIYVDEVEKLACKRALKLFKLDPKDWRVNVQSYSGSPANLAIYFGLTNFGDKIMGMSLICGGHLTHGHKVSFSGQAYRIVQYGVNPKTGLLDYNEIKKMVEKVRPKMLICGATAYSRIIDFRKFGQIAKKVGAFCFADIAHIAGLVATGLHPSPFPYCDVVMTTTHKTLRGPRGAVIFCKKELAERIDRAVFPGLQGGPHDHQTAAIVVAIAEDLKPSFKKYIKQVVKNAKVLADELLKLGFEIITGGTDIHLFLINVRKIGLSGEKAEKILEKVGIVVNKNTIPGDKSAPLESSGIRIGTPAVTTRGMKEKEMRKIAGWIFSALKYRDKERVLEGIKKEVEVLTEQFPVP